MEQLISTRYITSQLGSTDRDLIAAAEDLGLHATSLTGLGRKSLLYATDPLILHVSPRGIQGSYTHWLLFLGMNESGLADVFDGAGGPVTCSLEEILSRWDGKGIAIHRDETASTAFNSIELSEGIWLLLVAFLSLFAMEHVSNRFRQSDTPTCLVGLLGLAAALTVTHCMFTRTDAQSVQMARAAIASGLGYGDFLEIDNETLRMQLEDPSTLLIDARYSKDFESGHIPEAINLPIDAGWGVFRAKLVGLSRTRPVVVYCLSEECHFADYVAAMLSADGFTNISIFRGGFNAWKQGQRT